MAESRELGLFVAWSPSTFGTKWTAIQRAPVIEGQDCMQHLSQSQGKCWCRSPDKSLPQTTHTFSSHWSESWSAHSQIGLSFDCDFEPWSSWKRVFPQTLHWFELRQSWSTLWTSFDVGLEVWITNLQLTLLPWESLITLLSSALWCLESSCSRRPESPLQPTPTHPRYILTLTPTHRSSLSWLNSPLSVLISGAFHLQKFSAFCLEVFKIGLWSSVLLIIDHSGCSLQIYCLRKMDCQDGWAAVITQLSFPLSLQRFPFPLRLLSKSSSSLLKDLI